MEDIQEMQLGLMEELHQFEEKQEQIGAEIIEAKRRIGILDEAIAWCPVEVEPYQEFSLEDAFQAALAEDTEVEWLFRVGKLGRESFWIR